MDARTTSRRRRIQTAIGLAGLLGFVLATSVDARQPPPEDSMPMYVCEPPYPPEASLNNDGFGPHGGWWSTHPPADAAEISCAWVANAQQIPATLEHYLARTNGYSAYLGWTWFSSETALDPALLWALYCNWLPAGCTPETCSDSARQWTQLPSRPIVTAKDPVAPIMFADPTLEEHLCNGLGPMLRLRIGDHSAWDFFEAGGVLRVGYADGAYAVTSLDQDDYANGGMILVPPPVSGETWFGVEVVRGDGTVLDAVRFDLQPSFWNSLVIVGPIYYRGRGYLGAGGSYEEPQSRGCRRSG
jgi:hypothetical protein